MTRLQFTAVVLHHVLTETITSASLLIKEAASNGVIHYNLNQLVPPN